MNHTSGTVKLVGAGPGDPDLITVKALRYIQLADVIIYDRLVNHDLLADAADTCKLIYAGKRKNLHVLSQAQIISTMIDCCREGKYVVRLKGGDPFIFGRGGEEIDALMAAGCDWEVVPGISAAQGAASSAAMPLTERGETQAVTFITAHRQHGRLDVDWDLVLRPNQTVVFYMGLSLIDEIVDQLISRGADTSTSFTVMSNATRDNEILVTGTIENIVERVASSDVRSPALLVMGARPRSSVAGLLTAIDVEKGSTARTG